MYRHGGLYKYNRERCWHPVSNNYYDIELAKKNWYYNLNEAHHLYEPESDSIYRKALETLATDIWDRAQYNWKPEKIFKTESENFISFVLKYPFRSEPILGGIEILRIFLTTEIKDEDGASALVIADNDSDGIVINQEDKPLFKIEGNHIKILSIVLYIPKSILLIYDTFEETIFEILPHELTHTMDSIRDRISLQQSLLLNDVRYTYLDKMKNIDTTDIINRVVKNEYIDYNNPIEWYCMFNEWIYYTEKTEIKAYLETTYSNFLILSKKHSFLTPWNSANFQTYYKYYIVLNNLIKDWSKIKFKYKNIADELLDNLKSKLKILIKDIPELKNKFEHEYAFITVLKYWKKQLLKYLKKAESIFKWYYPTRWEYWLSYKEEKNIKF